MKKRAPQWVLNALLVGEGGRDEGDTTKLSQWMQRNPEVYGLDTHAFRPWSEIMGRTPTLADLKMVQRRRRACDARLKPLVRKSNEAEAIADKANGVADKANAAADAAALECALAEDEERLIKWELSK